MSGGWPPGIGWTCHVCGEWRPDAKISVRSRDSSGDYGLPRGTVRDNVRYCNDRPACIESSRTHTHFGKPADALPVEKQIAPREWRRVLWVILVLGAAVVLIGWLLKYP